MIWLAVRGADAWLRGAAGMPEEMVTVYQVTQRGYALIAAGPLPETAGPDGTKFNLGWVSAVDLCSTCFPHLSPHP